MRVDIRSRELDPELLRLKINEFKTTVNANSPFPEDYIKLVMSSETFHMLKEYSTGERKYSYYFDKYEVFFAENEKYGDIRIVRED